VISENPELAKLHEDLPIRVGVADERKVVREALRHLLPTQEDTPFVGEASTGFEALRLADDTAMDGFVVLYPDSQSLPVLTGAGTGSRRHTKTEVKASLRALRR